MLQLRDSDRVGHEAPPACAASVTRRLLVCWPPPQITGQLLQLDQVPTVQSTIRNMNVVKACNITMQGTEEIIYAILRFVCRKMYTSAY